MNRRLLPAAVIGFILGSASVVLGLDVGLTLEVNETDGDAKVILHLDSGQPVRRVRVTGPTGVVLAEVEARGAGGMMTRIELELEDTTVEAVTKACPEGTYSVRALTRDGEFVGGEAELSHEVLPATSVSPSGGQRVSVEDLTVRWDPVENAAGYIVSIEQGATDLSWEIDPGTHEVEVPAGLLRPGYDCELDVSVVAANGNVTLTETHFAPVGGRGDDGLDASAYRNLDYAASATHPYFVLEPGYHQVLAGTDGKHEVALEVTVLRDVAVHMGVTTRVVEERTTRDGVVTQIVRSHLAASRKTGDLTCFAEEIQVYEDGALLSEWASSTPYVLLPGRRGLDGPKLSSGKGLVGARLVGVRGSVTLDSGTYRNVIVVLVERAIDPPQQLRRTYAAGVGLVKNDGLELAEVGFIVDDDDEDGDGEDDFGDDDDDDFGDDD